MEKVIEDIYNFFQGNPVFNLISLVLGVAGIVFSFYFYFKSKRNKVPIYLIRTVNLIKHSVKKIETVDILFSGRKIDNLSLTKIAFWNDGKDTISINDVAKNQPMKIVISNGLEILDAKIIFQKNVANDFQIDVSQDKRFASILFDYFDFEEGIVIQLAHTGDSSEDINIIGQVKSVKKIHRKEALTSFFSTYLFKLLTSNNKKTKIDKKTKNKFIPKFMGYASVFIGVFSVSMPFISDKHIDVPKEPGLLIKIMLSGVGLLYVWFGYNIIKKKIPKGFDIFNEEF